MLPLDPMTNGPLRFWWTRVLSANLETAEFQIRALLLMNRSADEFRQVRRAAEQSLDELSSML